MKHFSSIGKYKIIRFLGGGQYGDVYLAHDTIMNSEKAIKIIHNDHVSEINKQIKEADILDKCRHKHIVQINDADIIVDEEKVVLVLDLEYISEGSLESELKQRWISVKEACCRLSHALSGLHHAHLNGYLHKDIKPANILICGDSTKLSDFGLATTPYDIFGYVYYSHCAPEVNLYGHASVKSDIYAAGLTLFRVMNNITDWRDLLDRITNVERHIENGTLIKTIGYREFVPQKLKRIVNKACNCLPEKRYTDALAMKNALDSLRFNIDWVRNSEVRWTGSGEKDDFEINIYKKRSGCEVQFMKNLRRHNEYCKILKHMDEAHAYVYQMVSLTTLL